MPTEWTTPARAGLTLLCCLAAAAVSAQSYPTKPIRIISPYAPGGTTDILSRLIAPKVTESLGQQVIVDNRPGGNTVIGSQALVAAPADGHTLLSILTSHVIVPNLVKTPYDPVTDFAAVATLANTQLVLVVHPSVPAKDLKSLIALARSRPGELNYGSGGSGTVTHLTGEFFNIRAGTRIQHIPYKGSAHAMTDLIGGQVHMYFSPPIVVMPHLESARLRAIVTSGDKRLEALPDLPTATEAGLKDFVVNIWYGVLAPAGTPRPVIDKLNGEIGRILALPDIRERLSSQGMEPFVSTPDAFATLIREDAAKYTEIIQSANIKLVQ